VLGGALGSPQRTEAESLGNKFRGTKPAPESGDDDDDGPDACLEQNSSHASDIKSRKVKIMNATCVCGSGRLESAGRGTTAMKDRDGFVKFSENHKNTPNQE